MNTLIVLPLALTVALAASSGFAADAHGTLSAGAVAAHQRAVAKQNASIAKLLATRSAGAAAGAKSQLSQPKDVVNPTVYPNTPMANVFRAYPPSCAADPVPDVISNPIASSRVNLFATDGSGDSTDPNNAGTEAVTITVWRIACSSSGSTTPYNSDGSKNAMTFMRVDRDSENNGVTTFYPTMPQILLGQGSVAVGDTDSIVRVAAEPNTVVSEVPFDAPIYQSTTYVLENYPDPGYTHVYDQAFSLFINPATVDTDQVTLQIPDYSPTQSTYPDAFSPRFLDGYAAAQWTNASLGEGLLVQVAEQYDANGNFTRQLVFDLLTLDLNGNPFWLIGNAPFPLNTRSLDVSVAYLGAQNAQLPWGKATITVPDCNHLNVNFTPNGNLAAPVPSFTGNTVYDRLFSENGMTCE